MDESESSLLEYLDLSQLTCLNEAGQHNVKSILASKVRNSTSSFLESDVDEQLLINITFNQTVRIRAVAIQSPTVVQAPRRVKLYINSPSLGFDNIEEGASKIAQEIELSEDQVSEGKRVPLRYVRFQAVNSLHIFVESNHGDDEHTCIGAIDVFGFPVLGARDLSGLKRQGD
ncbi:Thioredoxin-like protein [Sparassis crispa]|uniref:Thioredoxin-like protein n=1 Tax=Sparassis crispa TaxID=139825 RepID=A0A401GKB6_9APHY|nr:Thioredoxin-like protein [Sparassis crispa]GBE82584.1 Thioredoxin-like protein [Sparassis crispa]